MIEAMKAALGKVRAAQQCHPNATMTLLCEADEILRQAIEQSEKVEPVATVAEVHMSRHTIEWTNGPLPEGTKLYLYPAPAQGLFVDMIAKHEGLAEELAAPAQQPLRYPACPSCDADVLYECVFCGSSNYPQPPKKEEKK